VDTEAANDILTAELLDAFMEKIREALAEPRKGTRENPFWLCLHEAAAEAAGVKDGDLVNVSESFGIGPDGKPFPLGGIFALWARITVSRPIPPAKAPRNIPKLFRPPVKRERFERRRAAS